MCGLAGIGLPGAGLFDARKSDVPAWQPRARGGGGGGRDERHPPPALAHLRAHDHLLPVIIHNELIKY